MERHRPLAEGPLGNSMPRQSIVPPSIKKPNRLGRPSMIPHAAQRQSTMPSNAPTALTHSSSQEQLRRSTMANGNGMMSGNRGDGGMYGRTSQASRQPPGSVRRSSVFPSGGARQSIAPGAFQTAGIKDTRPLRNGAYQQACQANIGEYLANSRCPVAVNARLLSSPTLHDFIAVFKHLVSDFTTADSWSKKFEADALVVLRDLKYPGVGDISKTALGTPGSPTNWHQLLGMLNWLVELNRAHEQWADPELITDPLLQTTDSLPIEHPLFEQRVLWEYAKTTYWQWYHQEMEEWAEADQQFEEAYDRLAQASYDEMQQVETDLAKRRAELDQLKATEPPLKRLEEEYVNLMSDQTKFIAYIDMHKQKGDKLRLGIEKGKQRVAELEMQLEQLRSDLIHTEEAVAAQNLSPDEVQRMNHERESLSRNLDDLRGKIIEASQQAYDQEMQVTKSMDRFEALLSDYTTLAHQIGTITAKMDGTGFGLGPDGVDYVIDVDLGVEDVNEIIAGSKKLRATIWPALQAYSERFRAEGMDLDNQKIALEDDLDKRSQAVEGMRDEAEVRQTRLTSLQDQAEGVRVALQKATAENNERERKLEFELQRVIDEKSQGMLTHQAALEEKRIQFDELRHKTSQLADSMVKEISRHIDVIIKAKEHTANCLKGLRTFAETH